MQDAVQLTQGTSATAWGPPVAPPEPAEATAGPVPVASILGRTLDVYGARFPLLVTIAAVVWLPVSPIIWWVPATETWVSLVVGLAVGLASIPFQAAIVAAVWRLEADEQAGLRSSYGAALGRLWPLLGANIVLLVLAVAVPAGLLVILIIPALIAPTLVLSPLLLVLWLALRCCGSSSWRPAFRWRSH